MKAHGTLYCTAPTHPPKHYSGGTLVLLIRRRRTFFSPYFPLTSSREGLVRRPLAAPESRRELPLHSDSPVSDLDQSSRARQLSRCWNNQRVGILLDNYPNKTRGEAPTCIFNTTTVCCPPINSGMSGQAGFGRLGLLAQVSGACSVPDTVYQPA